METHPNAKSGRIDPGPLDGGPVPRRFETDRLALRRAHPDDVEFDRVHALFSDVDDPGAVFEHCGWDRHADEDATRAYLADRAERWADGEFFEYLLVGADDDELLGTACVERSGTDGAVEFGIWLRESTWGRGFAGEATDVLVHAAFEYLDAPYVVVGCLAANDRSRRAIERLVDRYGGAYVGSPPTVPSSAEKRDVPDVTLHHEWAITRDDFGSGEAGLSTTIPGVTYDDLEF